MRILVLADRDWTHPEAGGSGHNLNRQVQEFLARGHEVSVIAAGYPGCARTELRDGVEIMRVAGRTTVFPAAIWVAARGAAARADVVLEVINGITFLTPLWLRRPHVALVHHVHAGSQYVEEMGWLGRPAGLLLETVPLRRLYRGTMFVCVSKATQVGLISRGIPRSRIAVSYNGVDETLFVSSRRADAPTFLVLGRLKRYKRIELVLEAIAELPTARLAIAGDGSHRAEIEAAVARHGLEDRVILHGYVDEPAKRELLRSAWGLVTASAAEGWGLTIAEAAACGTPSIGLATGGLREAIVHEHTGLLARDPSELREQMARLADDRALVERLGAQARERVEQFTWERTAQVTLDALTAAAGAHTGAAQSTTESPPSRGDTVRAAGLAAAVIANNVIALVCTVLFARWLGFSRYGMFASLLSCFLILTVPGSAVQAAVARDVSRQPGGCAERLAYGALRAVWLLALPLAAVTVLMRAPIASLLSVDLPWASAAAVWFGWLWVALSLRRGIAQGHGRYRSIGASLIVEALGRLLFGAALVAVGLGATGALLGTGFAIACSYAVLARADHVRERPPGADALWRLARRAGAPLTAVSLVAVLQNEDVILVRHGMTHAAAGLYSEAAIAARGILWFGVGLGLFLLPEASRRARMGDDPRGVLGQMIALVCVLAAPLIAVFAIVGAPLLRAVFHTHRDFAATGAALPLLCLAMTLLAISFLIIQYLLALRRRAFVWPLLGAMIGESTGVLVAGASFARVALVLVAVQALLLGWLLLAALHRPGERLVTDETVLA